MINNFYQADDPGIILFANDLSNIDFSENAIRGFFRKEDLPNMITAAETQLQAIAEAAAPQATAELENTPAEQIPTVVNTTRIAGVRIYNYDTRDLTLARVVGTDGMEIEVGNVLGGTPLGASRSAGKKTVLAKDLGALEDLGDGSAAFFSTAKLVELNNRSDIDALMIFEIPLAVIDDAHLAIEELQDQAQNLITEKEQLTTLMLVGVRLDSEDQVILPANFRDQPNILSNRPIPGYAMVVSVQASPGVFPDNNRPALKFEPYLVPWDNKDKPADNEA